jgi:hypothetical protein
MKTRERIFVYLIGLGIGILIVSMLLSRRADKAERSVDPWLAHNKAIISEGAAEPLPETLPRALKEGEILEFGYLPVDSEAPSERVWILNFDASYPYVRVVQSLESGALEMTAADQIVIHLKPGVDVTELSPMLEALGLRLRMFNRKEDLAVVGVLNTDLDTVPATIKALQPWAELFASAEPDYIRLQPERPE